jgi:hypothetical protein
MGQTKGEKACGRVEVRFRLGKPSAFHESMNCLMTSKAYEDDFVCGHFSDTSSCGWAVKGGGGGRGAFLAHIAGLIDN